MIDNVQMYSIVITRTTSIEQKQSISGARVCPVTETRIPNKQNNIK